jgi:hypothetical protein
MLSLNCARHIRNATIALSYRDDWNGWKPPVSHLGRFGDNDGQCF